MTVGYIQRVKLLAALKKVSNYQITASAEQLESNLKKAAKDPNTVKRIVKMITEDKQLVKALQEEVQEIFDWSKEEAINAYKQDPATLIKKWIEDSTYSLRGAKFKGEFIRLYRKLGVENIDEFITSLRDGKFLPPYTGLGIHWGYDLDTVNSWEFWSETDATIILHGLVAIKDINFKETLIKACDPLIGICESEVVLKNGAPITVIQIDEDKIKPIQTNASLDK